MTKYRVLMNKQQASTYLVEAEDEEDARGKAYAGDVIETLDIDSLDSSVVDVTELKEGEDP